MLIRPNRVALAPTATLLALALIAGCSDSDDDGPPPAENGAPTGEDMEPGTGMDMNTDTDTTMGTGTDTDSGTGTDTDTDTGTDTDTDTDTGTDTGTGTDTDTGTDMGVGSGTNDGALTSEDLAGTWATGCLLDDPEDPGSEYESASITFTGDAFSFEGDSYRDAGCTESLGEAAALSGTYELGGLVVTTEGLETTELDLTIPGEDDGDPSLVLALAHLANGSLYFANGDLGELEDLVGQPRPDTLELDEPFMLQP